MRDRIGGIRGADLSRHETSKVSALDGRCRSGVAIAGSRPAETSVAILAPSNSQWQPRTFRDALSELGYREGVNLSLEVISAENQLGRLPKLAVELVASAPDVIVAVNAPGTRAVMQIGSMKIKKSKTFFKMRGHSCIDRRDAVAIMCCRFSRMGTVERG